MTDKEAMKLALDALESCTPLDTSSSHVIYPWYDEKLVDKAIAALKKQLAQPEQEPMAWIHIDPDKPKVKFLEWKENEHGYRGRWIKKPLYLHPPQRTEPTCPECKAEVLYECVACSSNNYPPKETT